MTFDPSSLARFNADLADLATRLRPDSPTLARALEEMAQAGRIARAEVTKSRARKFIAPETRHELDMLVAGLSEMEPDEALERLELCRQQPMNFHRVAALNIRGAKLAMRYLRLALRSAEEARFVPTLAGLVVLEVQP
jgi:hypothetical protein